MTDATVSSITSLYYTPTISFSGLGSDLDSASIIEALVEAESVQMQRMETWKAEWTAKITALQTLNTKMTDFKSTVAAMDTAAKFQAKTASSSDTTVVTASAASTAAAGSHQVLVGQLAQNAMEAHRGLSASTTVINNSGSSKVFAFSYAGGATVSIAVPDQATLSDLATAINNSGANPGVTASVLDLGAAAGSTRYRLLLQGNDSGADNTIVIDDATTTLDGTGNTTDFRTATFSVTQAAQNACIRVDGYPPDTWIERSSNVVADVVTGLSLTLKSPSFSPPAASSWGGAPSTSTSAQTAGGTGTANDQYTFTVETGGSVGTGTQSVKWLNNTTGASGVISVTDTSANTVEGSLTMAFGAGTLVAGNSFTLAIDGTGTPEAPSAWSNSSSTTPTVGGIYTGNSSKTFTVSVTEGGSVTPAAGDITLHWTDGTNSGDITLDSTYNGDWVEVAEGTKLRFSAGSLVDGASFTYDVTPVGGNTPVQITVSDDTSTMQEKVGETVTAYNDVIAYIKDQTKYDSETGEAGILLGNYALQIVKSELNAIGTGNAPGFKNPNDPYTSDPYINLAQIGITTDVDQASDTFGQLLIDDAALTEAFVTDPQGVAKLMSNYFQGIADDSTGNISYYSYVPGVTEAGTYAISATVSGGVLTSGTIDGHTATVSGDTLTGASGYPEYGLSVRVNLVDGTHTGQIRLQLGKNGQFSDKLDDLLDTTSGPINILINNYQDIVDSIDGKIAFEERRLEQYQNRLVQQFARLEATLAELNDQADYLIGQLDKLKLTAGSSSG
ncbi:MAG: flagellar filament capping protein FliD [Thermodesulfobacteriota bacterium]